jgi:hypothetical protein
MNWHMPMVGRVRPAHAKRMPSNVADAVTVHSVEPSALGDAEAKGGYRFACFAMRHLTGPDEQLSGHGRWRSLVSQIVNLRNAGNEAWSQVAAVRPLCLNLGVCSFMLVFRWCADGTDETDHDKMRGPRQARLQLFTCRAPSAPCVHSCSFCRLIRWLCRQDRSRQDAWFKAECACSAPPAVLHPRHVFIRPRCAG